MTANDQSQVIPAARRLIGFRAFRGAALILFNAAQQQAAKDRDLTQWTPDGPLPVSRQTAEKLHAANDTHSVCPFKPDATIR